MIRLLKILENNIDFIKVNKDIELVKIIDGKYYVPLENIVTTTNRNYYISVSDMIEVYHIYDTISKCKMSSNERTQWFTNVNDQLISNGILMGRLLRYYHFLILLSDKESSFRDNKWTIANDQYKLVPEDPYGPINKIEPTYETIPKISLYEKFMNKVSSLAF